MNNNLRRENTVMCKFKLCVSVVNYTQKPTKEECGKIRFRIVEVDVNGMIGLVKEGYVYTSLMKNGWRSGENFVCSRTLTYDIDGADCDMRSYINELAIKPTFAYTSSSNGIKGYRFRLVYVLDSDICSDTDYEGLSRGLAEQLSLKSVDEKSYSAVQMWFGCVNCDVFESCSILRMEQIKHSSVEASNKPKPKKDSQNIIIPHKHYGLSVQFLRDYETLSLKDLIEKYNGVYENIMKTPMEVEKDVPIVFFPPSYFEIRRPWKRINGETVKIKDGEGRRRKLFLNGIIRRRINPSLTYENLVYNLVWELYYYYINDGNKISKRDILEIAKNAINADVEMYGDLGKPRNKFFVNPLYCKEHGMTPKQVLGQTRNKKQYIGELYDASLTDKKNVEVMKEYGLDVNVKTLQRWRNENGIKKYKKNLEI